MSEFQYVAFRAIDAPVSKKNLAFMRRQSSRAEITSRSFTNEYHFGDFRGNAVEMLQRGYDIHLHYGNFGIRSLFVRLPQGFPDSKAAKPYLDGDSLHFTKDRNGTGGVLKVEPCYEPGDFDEDLWNLDDVLDRIVSIRREIIDGDLRPLYLAHLAVSCDSNHDPDEAIEAPVPAGLGELTKAQCALGKLWGIDPALLAAAAGDSPASTAKPRTSAEYLQWLRTQPSATKDAWLAAWMDGTKPALRSEVLTAYRVDQPHSSWPVVKRGRTIAELREAAAKINQVRTQKAASEAARKQAGKLAKMATDPKPFLQQSEKLVAQRSTDAYKKVAKLLAELREALAGTNQAGLAETQARKLKEKYPTLHHLTAALRRQGFVPKA